MIEVSDVNENVNIKVQKRHWILAYVARNEYFYVAKQKDSLHQCQCTKLQNFCQR